MPLAWKIDPANSLAVVVASGDVTRPDVDGYLDALIDSDALTYRKVFDVHKGDTSMTADDVLPLAVRLRSLHELGPMGPLAIVLPPGRGKRLQRALGMVAAAKRPMRIFDEPFPAYRWIAKQDIPNATEAPDRDVREVRAKRRALAKLARRWGLAAHAEAEQMAGNLERCSNLRPTDQRSEARNDPSQRRI